MRQTDRFSLPHLVFLQSQLHLYTLADVDMLTCIHEGRIANADGSLAREAVPFFMKPYKLSVSSCPDTGFEKHVWV